MEWTIQDLGAAGEAVAAVAVLFSVLYLAIQIRDGSRSNRANAVATLLSQYDSPNSVVSSSTENARVFRLGFSGSDELTEDEQMQFEVMCMQYMTVYHAAFRFHRDSILGDQHWRVFRRDLVEFTDYPGLKAMRDYFLAYYAPDSEFASELSDIYNEKPDHKDPKLLV